jgi:hypothetical protein
VTWLRKAAAGRPCQVRLPGICNHDPETVVLAHFRIMGVSGMALKSPDFVGAHACSMCHHAVDTLKDDRTQLAFAHGVFRTQYVLMKEGLVKVP